MCGASSEQKEMFASQKAFYDQLTTQYTQVFGKFTGIMDTLTAVYKPIFDKGPEQRGFSDEERTALESGATEGVAANYGQAKTAIEEGLAAEGGGEEFLPSGSKEQIRGAIATSAAAQRAGMLQQVTEADYATGRDIWKAAASGLAGEGGLLNPVGFANATTGAGSAASDTATAIANANNSWGGALLGLAGGIAGAAVGGFAGGGGGFGGFKGSTAPGTAGKAGP